MNYLARGLTIALLLTSARANAIPYSSSECVQFYNGCNEYNLNNTCDNVAGFNNVIQYSSFALTNNWSNSAVFDTDTIESSLNSSGEDYKWTDKSGTAIEYLSMHGVCGNYAHGYGFCNYDYQCGLLYGGSSWQDDNGFVWNNLTWRCDTNSHTCSGYLANTAFYRKIKTCGSFDTQNHIASITHDMRFGEKSLWAGLGYDGDLNFAIFDTSCPFAAPFYTEMNSQMFVGLHLAMGFTASPNSDARDSATRGNHFGNRLNSGQGVGPAWLDTSRLDLPSDAGCPGVCAVAMSCETQESQADYRLNYETVSNASDPTQAPQVCKTITWCC